MRIIGFLALALGAVAVVGCGTTGPSGFDSDSGTPLDDSGLPVDDGGQPEFPDSDVDGTAPPCVGLKCQQVTCGGGGKTTVTGTVYDPAGKNPIYNVVVYVPNTALDPIKHGPVCDSCGGANVSGSPVVTALTDATGKFVLENVPVGANIPLVMQAGKWRRKIILPNVTQCVDNPVGQKTAGIENLTRLPKNKSEGDMPLIALTAGCDPIHTLVQKIGVDPAEITSENGTGTVQVFAGSGYNGGVSGATDAYAFWGTKAKMMKYDIIINECECSPHLRSTVGPAYANMKDYLNAGGRVFNSHYHLNFFGADPSNPSGTPDPMLSSAATWTLWGGSGGGSPYMIDTTFPKGKAMDDWLHNLKTASGWGPTNLPITSPKGQIIVGYNDGDIAAAKAGLSQRWIYTGSGGSAVVYLSINMPTNVPADQRCGRAVGSDMHVGNGSLANMTEQEAALEFMFFDLASCVIDDGKVPVPPPPN